MRPGKRSRAAKDREEFKKRRIDSPTRTSEGSCYAPSELECDSDEAIEVKEASADEHARSAGAREALRALLVSETGDLSDSDGEIMLDMGDTLDENDWDPQMVPDLYPIFTSLNQSFKVAEKSMRAPVYTGKSRTSGWRRQVSAAKRAKEAETCGDIRNYFTTRKKTLPCTQDSQLDIRSSSEPEEPEAAALEQLTPTHEHKEKDEVNQHSSTWSKLENIQGLPVELGVNLLDVQSAQELTHHPKLSSGLPLHPIDPPNHPACSINPPESTADDHSAGCLDDRGIEQQLEALTVTNAPDLASDPSDTSRPFNLPVGEVENSHSSQDSEDSPGFAPAYSQNLSAPSRPDSSVRKRLEELRQKLQQLQTQLEKQMKAGKQKIDPRDPADMQALLDYCTLAEQLYHEGCSSPEMTASLQIARTKASTISKDGKVVTKGAWYARTLRTKAKHVQDFGKLPERRQGKGASHETLLDNPSVRSAVEAFIENLAVGKVTPRSLMNEVNNKILRSLSLPKTSITECTAKKWLLRLGYRRDSYRKGIYMDGHEREDVVEYRKLFLDKVQAYESRMQQYTDKDCEPIPLDLPQGTRPIIPTFHDECCFHANDQATHSWIREGQTLLRQKGRGRLIHVSDFIVEGTGRLTLSEAEIEAQLALPERQRLKTWDARKIIYPGKNQDAYWDMPQLIDQIKDAIKIFEFKNPGAQMLLFVDQSSAHNAYASNALNARKMNVSPGGKQPVMHDTMIPLNNPNPALQGKHQSMIFDHTHPKHPNEPKGMEVVLKERGLWSLLVDRAGGKRPLGRCRVCKATAAEREKILAEAQAVIDDNPDIFGSIDNVIEVTHNESLDAAEPNPMGDRFCCMEKCLATEADFQAEKPLLQLVVEEAGHLCILLPKFHCELNPIEMYWGHAKQKFRAQCNGSFPLAKELVPKCLDACLVITIRRFFQKTWRYMDAYRHGLTGLMAEHAVKKFASHRKITKQIMMEVALLAG